MKSMITQLEELKRFAPHGMINIDQAIAIVKAGRDELKLVCNADDKSNIEVVRILSKWFVIKIDEIIGKGKGLDKGQPR